MAGLVLDSLKRLSETGPDAGNGENMTPKILKVFILAMLAMYAFSVHAVTSTFYNKSQSRVSVRFYSRANQSTGMVQQGSEVLLNAGSSRTFSGPGDAGEFYVRNDGISIVSVYVVTDSNPPDYIGYGDLYSGNGVYSVFIGGGASAEVRDSAPVECSATPVRWGAGNFCSATPVTTANGGIANLTNSSAGASGSAVATCSAGTWTVSSASCSVSLVAPIGLFATDAVNANSINITWGSSQGASSYRLQSRKVGSSTWTDLATPSTASYNWTGLSDESIFEFQVRAENSLGSSPWSAVETGSIRPKLAPTFVSQTGIPPKIGTGQAFTYTQTWKNNGSETWTGGTYGTGPDGPANTSVWGAGFSAFTGSIATGASTTTTISAVAPTVPGTYPIQRIFWKSGSAYGVASTPVNVEVVGPPTCTGIATNIATTYNVNGTVTVTLQGPSSVDTATIKAWGEANGQDDAKDYAMSFGSNWSVTIPVSAHLSPDETKINFEARVGNSLFAAAPCATGSLAFQQLPVPTFKLTPTMGSYDPGSLRSGFVADRANGAFATINVALGNVSDLKVKVELSGSAGEIGVSVPAGSSGVEIPLRLLSSKIGSDVPAWTAVSGNVRVTYADQEAASQLKVASQPIEVLVAPSAMQVAAQGTLGLPPAVNARVSKDGAFETSLHGAFQGGLLTHPDKQLVKPLAETTGNGEWSANDLDYSHLFKTQLVAVARATPPVGVVLLQPLEFYSAPFTLPVQAPAAVSATDGTREDDVKVTWTPPAVDSSIRYRVFRDQSEISPAGGMTGAEFIDVPPSRGQVFTYRVKTLIGSASSAGEAADTGFVPTCRAPRLIGASLNADMTRINGLLERWQCLESAQAKGLLDLSPEVYDLAITGAGDYRSFSFPLPDGLADGAHVLNLNLNSTGVSLFSQRTYEIPFLLNRASIAIKSLTILYDGRFALPGLEANSVGRFGIKMDGGTGIGFAEEMK